jgi:hypothetical protein
MCVCVCVLTGLLRLQCWELPVFCMVSLLLSTFPPRGGPAACVAVLGLLLLLRGGVIQQQPKHNNKANAVNS